MSSYDAFAPCYDTWAADIEDVFVFDLHIAARLDDVPNRVARSEWEGLIARKPAA